MPEQITIDKPECPTCAPHARTGRPRNKVRPDVRLSTAYVSRIGADCGEMALVVSAAAGRAIRDAEQRELAIVAERLMQMRELFL